MFPGSTMASFLPCTSRRTRRCLTLDTKVDVISRKERGQKNCDICCAFGLPVYSAYNSLE